MAQQLGSNYYNSPYKFNGKELDEETGFYYYGARYYDPRISIWQSVDPLAEKYPNVSPYNYCLNNPINAIDPDGKEIIFMTGEGKNARNFTYRNGNFYDRQSGKRYNPGKENVSKTMYKLLTVYRKIESSNDKILKNQLHTLEKSDLEHTIYESKYGKNTVVTNGVTKDPEMIGPIATSTRHSFSEESKKQFEETTGVPASDFTTVVHEMRHQYDYDIGNYADGIDSSSEDPMEIRAVYNENRARKIDQLPKRTKYGGKKIDPKKLDNPPNNKNVIID